MLADLERCRRLSERVGRWLPWLGTLEAVTRSCWSGNRFRRSRQCADGRSRSRTRRRMIEIDTGSDPTVQTYRHRMRSPVLWCTLRKRRSCRRLQRVRHHTVYSVVAMKNERNPTRLMRMWCWVLEDCQQHQSVHLESPVMSFLSSCPTLRTGHLASRQ